MRYRYHSMVDLSDYPDGSVDLVYSGQSIEHVPPDVADKVLSEVRRVLRPGGYLGLDTPNARVTRLQQPDFIDPDHEHEYTDAEMRAKLASAGFEIVSAVGSEPCRPQPGGRLVRRGSSGNGQGHVQRDRRLLPARLPLPSPSLSRAGAWSHARVGAGPRSSGRGQRPDKQVRARGFEPPPPFGDRDLNPARLPIPPRPQGC